MFSWAEAVITIASFDPAEYGGSMPELPSEEKKEEDLPKSPVKGKKDRKPEEEQKEKARKRPIQLLDQPLDKEIVF